MKFQICVNIKTRIGKFGMIIFFFFDWSLLINRILFGFVVAFNSFFFVPVPLTLDELICIHERKKVISPHQTDPRFIGSMLKEWLSKESFWQSSMFKSNSKIADLTSIVELTNVFSEWWRKKKCSANLHKYYGLCEGNEVT